MRATAVKFVEKYVAWRNGYARQLAEKPEGAIKLYMLFPAAYLTMGIVLLLLSSTAVDGTRKLAVRIPMSQGEAFAGLVLMMVGYLAFVTAIATFAFSLVAIDIIRAGFALKRT